MKSGKKSGKSTLAAWLHRLGAEPLAQVLAARPDAVSPPEPRSVSELAERLQRPGSVALALPRLAPPCSPKAPRNWPPPATVCFPPPPRRPASAAT
ncbi:hypothetical protein GCM10010389_09180 [Streptomyces echinoruber]|uniref:Uncharacterized protein n=1 Tax=Streptomyces echinoruber TaxID=68898 RepID=A0A918V6S1_9ACTN|nr:hypothetical protein GCM10010389_09180 [Streptomyces echinoruber]